MSPQVLERPDIITDTGTNLTFEPMYQVVLWNDDVNPFLHVINTLQKVFGHNRQIAEKIADSAHKDGKAIAEVESKELAITHKAQLEAAGLTAEVEPIEL